MMNTIGERLAYARKLRGYTQSELAEASYVSRSVITNIETGRFSTQTVNYVAVAKTLNISHEWLIHGTEPMEVDNDRSKILDELYKVCSTLTESQQLFMLETIRSMQKHL